MTTHPLIIVCVLAGIGLAGCGSEEADTQPAGRMVYVDTKTRQPIVHEIVTPVPALNPETGERTLMPGLYCPACETWYPVPPPDQINSQPNAGQCPKDKTPLTADGPWPGGELPNEALPESGADSA
jgi:uncharacterized protein YbaR (Trm112 family)